MNTSLQSQISQMLPTDGSGNTNQIQIIQKGLLAFTGKVLVFKDTVYSLRNISSVQFSDNTKTFTKKIPIWYWIIFGLGIVTIPIIVGIFLLLWFLWLLYEHNKSKVSIQEEYGIVIEMNSGSSSVFLSSQKTFVLDVIYKLYEILNMEETQPLVFDFSNNVTNDKSINVEHAVGAALVSGKVIGNVQT
jgi:Family of unknown function (DUF6232)